MSATSAVIAILGAIMLGVISPGPSFIVVARNAIGLSRRAGLAAALGIGSGGLVFSGIALLGLFTLLTEVEWLYVGLKIAGGLYLIYLGYRMWRGAAAPLSLDDLQSAESSGGIRRRCLRSYRAGLTTQLSNPKAAVIYASIFAALLPPHPPGWCYAVLPPALFAIEVGWYTAVAVLFSSGSMRWLYRTAKATIDRVAATAISLLGLRLIITAHRVGI
jgi:threonine/homoserine/homoserine lactone efflux protein